MATLLIIGLIVFGMAALFIAGHLMALFECILTFDTVKLHLGDHYSLILFQSNKDRNNDGKTSYLERTFPNDGGHRSKLKALLLLFFGVQNFTLGAWILVGHFHMWMVLIIALLMFVIYSAGFEHGYRMFRYPPDEISGI